MTKKNTSNLLSPNHIRTPCAINDLDSWLLNEIKHFPAHLREAVSHVVTNLNVLIKFPQRAELLWLGCDRNQQYHRFPPALKTLARERGVSLADGRANGPAIGAFLVAGGERPKRYGSNNQWNIHHLYSSKFPYIGKRESLHAVKDGKHFTQSAGLVAAHPIADVMCDEFPEFAWFLRAQSFRRFGYDPDGAFAASIDEFGFANGCSTLIHYGYDESSQHR